MNTAVFREEAKIYADRHLFLNNFVLPDYQQYNISNVESVVGKIFSAKNLMKRNFSDDCVDDIKGVEKVVLFVLDGLGYNRLLSHMEKHASTFSEIAKNGMLKTFSSTFPSTTSTALTSIYTGLTPSEHGVIGFNMFVPEYGLIFNMLSMNPIHGFEGRLDLAGYISKVASPWPPLLRKEDVRVKIFTRSNLARSGLSNIVHKHQEIVSYALVTDLIVQIRKTLEQNGRMFLCVYYAGIDTLEHGYGTYSAEASAELSYFENLLKDQLFDRLSPEIKRQTLVLFTADHGAVDTLKTKFLDGPQLAEHFLIPPTGDMRAAYFFPKYGQREKLRKALEQKLNGFEILNSSDLIKEGAFGFVGRNDHLNAVVGELAALSQRRNIVYYPYFHRERFQGVFSAHGGMTADEMLVPFLSVRLSKV